MLTFRALELSDVDFLYQIENEETLWTHGYNTAPFSRFALEQYVLNSSASLYEDGQLRLVLMDEGQAVGLVDVFSYDAKHQRAEVGIALHADFRGRGRGTAALQLLIAYVRQHLHLHQLYAYVAAHNAPALHAFLAAGFSRTATLRDWISLPGGFCDAVLLQYVF